MKETAKEKAKEKALAKAKAAYEKTAERLNALLDSGSITSREYSLLWRDFEDKLRADAIRRAAYKAGDRITDRGGHYGRIIEITRVGACDTFSGEPWRYEVYYGGAKLDRYGRATKTQPKFCIAERNARPFEPRPLPGAKA